MHLELQGSGEERVARDRILGPVAGAPWHNKKKIEIIDDFNRYRKRIWTYLIVVPD